MNTDLWNKMVEETMSYKKPNDSDDFLFADVESANPDEQEDTQELKDSPGVLYFIDCNETEVSLRLEAHQCLKTAMTGLQDSFYYFATKSFELAEVITDHFHQKRFRGLELFENGPTEEGFLWWLKANSEKEFELVFGRARGIPRQGICLGHLGDESIAFARFQRSESLFAELGMKILSKKSNRMQFISTSEDSEGIKQFRRLLEHGDGLEEIYELLNGQIELTMHFYLREMAELRKFWLNFCHQLKNSTEKPLIH